MAAECNLKIMLELTGLGASQEYQDAFTTTTPTAQTHQYRNQNTPNTAEAIDLGDVATVELLVIRSISKAAQIDCDFDSSFNSDIELAEGQFCAFKPTGTVYINNTTTDDQLVYEYWAFGTI